MSANFTVEDYSKQPTPTQLELANREYENVKNRAIKAEKINRDLSLPPDHPHHQQSLGILRSVEAQARKDAGKGEYVDVQVDARGYTPQIGTKIHTSPGGKEQFAEKFVTFMKVGEDGETEYLTSKVINDNGEESDELFTINADLFSASLLSKKHKPGHKFSVRSVPMLSNGGGYSGIFSIALGEKPEHSHSAKHSDKKDSKKDNIDVNVITGEDIEKLNEKVLDKEHVFYRDKVAVLGDSHGKGEKPIPDCFNVCSGDYIDFKHDLKDPNDPYSIGLDAENFKQGVKAWIKAVESGEALYVMGNHDLKLISAMLLGPHKAQRWLDDGGAVACQALGIKLPGTEITDSNYSDFLNAIRSAPDNSLYKFYEMLLKHGKLYAVVNETYIAHTVPVSNLDGSQLPYVDGKSGIDALDELEKRIRPLGEAKKTGQGISSGVKNSALAVISGLTGSYLPPVNGREIYSPLWVRGDTIEQLYKDSKVGDRMIAELNEQARKKGTRVQSIMFGHTMEGGAEYANDKIINIDYAGHDPRENRLRAYLELQKDTQYAQHRVKTYHPHYNTRLDRPVNFKQTDYQL